jgi:hypothetical protein
MELQVVAGVVAGWRAANVAGWRVEELQVEVSTLQVGGRRTTRLLQVVAL